MQENITFLPLFLVLVGNLLLLFPVLDPKRWDTLKVKLRELVEMKKIKTFGKGRGVTYEIN